jgi:alpha-beta hydrolase superfamily lysophospholipase
MEVRRTQTHIRARLSRLRVPTLMVLAGDDRIVSTDAALHLAGLLGRYTDVDIKVYGELFHELYLEPGGDRVVGDITRWLAAHQSASPRRPQAAPARPEVPT